ncbi:ATP-binding protein [Tahibacter amnicola]|nr:ATP-binding protein [Tahibacter amnicola]
MTADETATPGERPVAEFPITVFLVDDQPMIGEAIRRMLLPEADIRYHYSANATEAVATAEKVGATVILQDLVMPGADGMALLRDYRANAGTRDIPVIVLSSKEEASVKSEAFAGGAHDYLVKLPDRIELVARIRHHSTAYVSQLQRDAAYRELQALNQRLESTQTQLLQSEKMASVGQLAAGIAHEINNPMAFVSANLGVLQRYLQSIFGILRAYERLKQVLGAGHPEVERINELEEKESLPYIRKDLTTLMPETLDGVSRVEKIVKDLKDYSMVNEAEWQKIDIHAAIESTLNVLSHRLNEKAEVIREYGTLPEIECVAFQIKQVLLNILVNATQALEGRGRITIRTGREGDQIWFSITDTGFGIEPEHLNRVFEPFFTTRPVGQGTGLGLSVSYNIVKSHGGTIDVESTPLNGATFTVRLPIRPERGEPAIS